MATYEIVPQSDVTAQWTSTGTPHADEINEDKDTPVQADNIQALDSDDNDIDDFNMTTDTISVNIISAEVFMYFIQAPANVFEVDFYDGSSWQGYQLLAEDHLIAWSSRTFAGLNMNQTAVNNCRVRFRAGVIGKGFGPLIATVYVVLDDGVSVGGPTGIEKVYGIDSSAIAKKYGTNWSDIAKIYGIS